MDKSKVALFYWPTMYMPSSKRGASNAINPEG